jgi:hypothetical protein
VKVVLVEGVVEMFRRFGGFIYGFQSRFFGRYGDAHPEFASDRQAGLGLHDEPVSPALLLPAAFHLLTRSKWT